MGTRAGRGFRRKRIHFHQVRWANRLHDLTLRQDVLDALPPLVKRLGQIAADWGAEFGNGIGDELSATADEWREKLG